MAMAKLAQQLERQGLTLLCASYFKCFTYVILKYGGHDTSFVRLFYFDQDRTLMIDYRITPPLSGIFRLTQVDPGTEVKKYRTQSVLGWESPTLRLSDGPSFQSKWAQYWLTSVSVMALSIYKSPFTQTSH